MKFYIVPIEIVNLWQNARKPYEAIYFRQDNQERWVVNEEVEELWPEIPWQDYEIVELTQNDFPTEETE